MSHHITDRVNSLASTFTAARAACMTALRYGMRATANVPESSDEAVYAAARAAASAPTVAEEHVLHDAMVAARTALATTLRAHMSALRLAVPLSADDGILVDRFLAARGQAVTVRA